MVKRPAVIIIVRHGTRLDAVDKDWHLSSSAPHDPPLTYGGWNQSRSLGVRIGRLLRAKEEEPSVAATPPRDTRSHTGDPNYPSSGPPSRTPISESEIPKRPLKVFIHSSPYQRCVQTSVAITAGLVQYRGLATHTHGRSPSTYSPPKQDQYSVSPHSSPAADLAPPSPTSLPSQVDSAHAFRSASSTGLPSVTSAPFGTEQNAILRIDAFLGEWLSPEYSILPKPPPNSDALVDAAKAELSRPSDAIERFSPSILTSQGSLWGSNNNSIVNTPDARSLKSAEGPGSSMRSLSSAFPASAQTPWLSDSDHHAHSFRHVSNPTPSLTTQFTAGYQAPIPAYAILPTEPIPKGYVAHARDACTDVDFEWDSLVAPLCWGDGGDYGEEWSALHKRFRAGLKSLINYYARDYLQDGFSPSHHRLYGHEEDDETAIIIVTHSAGCNALIGALTDQPVLLDVGMASLTMAVRKDDPAMTVEEHSDHDSFSTMYDMKIVASVDHLRASTHTGPILAHAPVANTQMPGPTSIPVHPRRNTLLTSNVSSSMPDGHWGDSTSSRRSSVNASLGSVRRPCISPVLSYRSDSLTSISSSTGLWTPTAPLPTSDYNERPNTAVTFSSPLSGSHAGQDDVAPTRARSTSAVAPDAIASSLASDATICAVDGANTPKPNPASFLGAGILLSPTVEPMPGRGPVLDSALEDALASAQLDDDMAALQASGSVNPASQLGTAAVSDADTGADHGIAGQGSEASAGDAEHVTTRPRATSRPQPIPHRGLQRASSQKGLWGSAPASVLEHRGFGPGRHP